VAGIPAEKGAGKDRKCAGLGAVSKESGRVHGRHHVRHELHLALAPAGVRGRGRGRNPHWKGYRET
jgi:hypothetical protein